MNKCLKLFLASILLVASYGVNSYAAAAITPDTVYQENLGSVRLVIAYFSAGTADDADTWASGLTSILAFFTADTDNPSTQGSVGVAAANSSGTFTFYPAEDNKPFYLFVLCRN